MDKIDKALNKLSEKERRKVKKILQQIKSGCIYGLDIKKLKDRGDIFRVRLGDIRIIYHQINGSTKILTVERRNEKTYKNN